MFSKEMVERAVLSTEDTQWVRANFIKNIMQTADGDVGFYLVGSNIVIDSVVTKGGEE